jgi:hypothetical protein
MQHTPLFFKNLQCANFSGKKTKIKKSSFRRIFDNAFLFFISIYQNLPDFCPIKASLTISLPKGLNYFS